MAVFNTTSRAQPTLAVNNLSKGQIPEKEPLRVNQHILHCNIFPKIAKCFNAATDRMCFSCFVGVLLKEIRGFSPILTSLLPFVFLGRIEHNSCFSRHPPVEDNCTGNTKLGSETSSAGKNRSYKPGCGINDTCWEKKQPKLQRGWKRSYIAHVDLYVAQIFLKNETLLFSVMRNMLL